MSFAEILILALALAADAFSVGFSIGVTHCRPRQVFRLSFHFGLFQALMALLGIFAGEILLLFLSGMANWIAFGVLAFIGGRMLWEGLFPKKSDQQDAACADPTRGASLVMLSVATSIDALGAGVGLAAKEAGIALPVFAIGVAALLCTWLAMSIGESAGKRIGRRAGIFGGVVLIALGVKMLLDLGG